MTQNDAAIADAYELAPVNLDDVFEGTFRKYRDVTLIGRTVHFRVTGSRLGQQLGGPTSTSCGPTSRRQRYMPACSRMGRRDSSR